MKMMISCREATLILLEQEERKLPLKERIQLQMHLAFCRFCRIFKKQNKLLSDAAKKMQDHIHDTLSDADKEEMVKKMQQS